MKTSDFGILVMFSVVLLCDYSFAETQRISARKCAEYSHTHHHRGCTYSVSPLLGYRPAQAREFPHSALIGIKKDTPHLSNGRIEWFCTGVLISHDFVLTLAECGLVTSITEATHVRLGDFNYGKAKDDADPIDIRVAERIIHPNYTAEYVYNNIALLRLEDPIHFNMHIRPACLPQSPITDVAPNALLAGWTFKLYSIPRSLRSKQDQQLRKYEMKMMTLEDCEQQFQRHIVKGMPHGIMETQLCATIVVEEGHTRSEHFKQLKPLEQIDGAPLQIVQDRDHCVYAVLGISHVKPSFGLKEVPLVFTRVYEYLAWIEDTVWRELTLK